MKFSEVAQGTRATREVELPLNDETVFKTLVRPLTGTEEAIALQNARAFAVSKEADPKEGEPLYELAYMANILAIGCLDPDSPKEARTPSFASAQEILDSEHLGRERIAFLYEHHELWQDACSPQSKKMSTDELFAALSKIAEADDDRFLLRWGPSLRASLLRTSARLSLRSLAASLSSGSQVDTSGPASKNPSETRPTAKES